jgi:glutamate synthase domain-containing protein 3
LGEKKRHQARFVGTGMHGGVIYVRGEVDHLGKEVEVSTVNEEDMRLISELTSEFCKYFGCDYESIMRDRFTKIAPISRRPYGNLYAY